MLKREHSRFTHSPRSYSNYGSIRDKFLTKTARLLFWYNIREGESKVAKLRAGRLAKIRRDYSDRGPFSHKPVVMLKRVYVHDMKKLRNLRPQASMSTLTLACHIVRRTNNS